MSAQSLQHVVCRGAIDAEFLRLLARAPAEALAGFDLAEDESAMIVGLRPQSLEDLARGVEAWRRGDVMSAPAAADAWRTAAVALAG